MRNTHILVTVVAIVLASCASQGVQLTQGTLLLGEVRHVLTSNQVAAGNLGPNTEVGNLSEKIHKWGFTDEQIASGRVIVVREGVYWNNVASGIKRDMLNAVLVPDGMIVLPGNIVEGIEGHPYTVYRVRATSLEEGKCYFDELPTGLAKGLLGAISLVGPSGAAILYCKGIENEGWQRPNTYWHKLPGGSIPN